MCYVAITRAKDHLYITNTKKRTLYGSTTYSIPSRFIDEIPENLLSEESLENKEEKVKPTTWLDSEYKRVETYLSNRSRVSENVETKVRPSIGISVDSFLKNISGTMSAAKSVTPCEVKYKVGMEVKHKKFGIGTIEKIEPEGDDFKLEIMFGNSGFKRLMANYTPLEILNDGKEE